MSFFLYQQKSNDASDSESDEELVKSSTIPHHPEDTRHRVLLSNHGPYYLFSDQSSGTCIFANKAPALPGKETCTLSTKKSTTADKGENPKLPLPSWAKSKSRARIVSELQNKDSDIFFQMSLDPSTGKYTNVNFSKIQELFADERYNAKQFKTNVTLLLNNFCCQKGDFDPKHSGVLVPAPWYTSTTEQSDGYRLLKSLHRHKKEELVRMTPEQVWASHLEFQKYDLDKLKDYHRNMKKLVGKKMSQAHGEVVLFREDCSNGPQRETTDRGDPLWQSHSAKRLLKQDFANANGKYLKPMDLWNSRKEYQEFSLNSFRSQMNSLKAKNNTKPFWQHKRNQVAEQMHRENKMREEWEESKLCNAMAAACLKDLEDSKQETTVRKQAKLLKCGACGKVGHNRSNKSCAAYYSKGEIDLRSKKTNLK